MKKVLKYLVVAVLFSFSVSSHADEVTIEYAHKILTEGEPIASGSSEIIDNGLWLSSALRYRGQIYYCRIVLEISSKDIGYQCFNNQ
jgi:hypothetical protein